MKQKEIFKHRWLWHVVFMTVLLSGCASTGLLPAHESAATALLQDKEQAARKVSSWKLSAEVQISQHNRSGRVRVMWIESKKRFKMRIAAITGKTLAVITGNVGGKVSAIDARGMAHYADNARKLVKDLLGTDIPVDHLRFWILGSPVPSTEVSDARQSAGELISFVQDGWQVGYHYTIPEGKEAAKIEQISMRSETVLVIANIRSLQKR